MLSLLCSGRLTCSLARNACILLCSGRLTCSLARNACILLCSGCLTCSLARNACILYERPAKCNRTKPSLMIGVGSSLYQFTWFGVPCSDFCMLAWLKPWGWGWLVVSLQKDVHLSEQFGRLFRSGLVDVEHPEPVDAANISNCIIIY